MKDEYLEIIKKSDTGENMCCLIFKLIKSNTLIFKYVKIGENPYDIIKKYTTPVKLGIDGEIDLGAPCELVYEYNYEFKPNKIEFDDMHDIEKGAFGYVDTEGNFYPIGKTDEHKYNHLKKYMAGRMANNIVMSLITSEQEKDNYRKLIENKFLEESYSPCNWSADEYLKNKGFCLFFRGIDDEGCYDDQSYFDNANKRQLIVMSYLYTLNYLNDTKIVENQKKLVKRYIDIEKRHI